MYVCETYIVISNNQTLITSFQLKDTFSKKKKKIKRDHQYKGQYLTSNNFNEVGKTLTEPIIKL